MSSGNKRTMSYGHLSNKSQLDPLNHLLVHLHQGIELSLTIRIFKNFRVWTTQSQGSVAHGGNKLDFCMCNFFRNHPWVCRNHSTYFFKSESLLRDFLKNMQCSGNRGNKAQYSLVDPPNRVEPKWATSGARRRTKCLYAITSHQAKENSFSIVTRMIKVITLIFMHFLIKVQVYLLWLNTLLWILIFFLRNFLSPSMFPHLLVSIF